MKKGLKKIISAILAMTMIFSLAACTPANPDGEEEPIDTSRTQLYVYNFNGGFGSKWLKAAKARFEKKHENDELESGKKGVQVIIKANKDSNNGDTFWNNIPKAREEVYFVENADYYKLVGNGLMLDITDAMTSPLSEYGETESIKDKMSAEQQAFFGVAKGEKTAYYGVPHYAGYWGIIYNKDLFDRQGYYFADDQSLFEASGQLALRFVQSSLENTKKSAGPDGKYDTDDDGLPTTYEEFFLLCDYIKEKKDIAIQWRGVSYSDYVQTVTNTFAVDFEGKDQWMLNYEFGSGNAKQATNLGRVVNGRFVKDSKPTTINPSNGYELARQEGKWHAVEIMKKICDPSYDDYHNANAYNNSYSHLDAQSDFLYRERKLVLSGI